MTGFSDTIKMIRAASSSDKPYYQTVQDVSRALCGHEVHTPSGGFKVICEALEEAHKKELDDMRRDVTDEAEEAKNFMVAQVVSRYNKQMEAMREECEQKVRAAIGNSQDANRIEHVRKEQYHRGYQDGLKARNVDMWQLDHDRAEVLARLVNSNFESGLVMRSLCFVLGVDWRRYNTTRSLGEMKARLAYLLGGAVEDSKLQKSPNFTNARTIIELSNDYADLVAERDGMLDLLRDAAKEYKELLDKYLAAPWEVMQPMDDEHMSRLGWMRALDRDGEPICMGDTVRYDEKDVPFVGEPFEVSQITHFSNGSCYVSGGWSSVGVNSVQCTHQEPKPDPIEQVIKDLTIGSITDVEAIERIRGLVNG